MWRGKGEKKMETEQRREKTGVDTAITQRSMWLGSKGQM